MLLLLLSLVGRDVLVYSPGFDTVAGYEQQAARVFFDQDPMLLCDTAISPEVEEDNVYFIGTPASPFYRTYYRDVMPVRFSGDTVAIGDSAVVASDFVFHCQFKSPERVDVELTLAQRPSAAVGEPTLSGHDFALSRGRDCGIDDTDLSCLGRLEWSNSRLIAREVVWHRPPARQLDSIADRSLTLYYEPALLDPTEAPTYFRVAELCYEALTRPFGISLPRPACIYLTQGPILGQARSMRSSRLNTIWLRYPDRAALADPSCAPVHDLAYGLASLALVLATDEYALSRDAEDWAEYASTVGVMPYVQGALGSTAWIVPIDYQNLGIPWFEKRYQGGKQTYAWLLYEIDQQYGQRFIGDAIKEILYGRPARVAGVRDLMTLLAGKTANPGIARRSGQAFPTPFGHLLFAPGGWTKPRTNPTLDEMFASGSFRVESAEPVPAGSLPGFKPGDRILKIDGFNPGTEKALCLRHLLKMNRGEIVSFQVQRGRKQVKVLVAIE